MTSSKVYLGLGSNLGDRIAYLRYAIASLKKELRNIQVGDLYKTEPLYLRDQPFFLNSVCAGEWRGSPEALLDFCQEIEAGAGRMREKERRRGERTLDIDILLMGDKVFSTARLSVPHPLLNERAFALLPLLDIDAGLKDPRSGLFFADLARELGKEGIYSHWYASYTEGEWWRENE